MKHCLIALIFAAITAPVAAAETLTNVSSWRDVSEFMRRHNVSDAAATMYVAETCETLPSISKLACLTEALTSPTAFEGLSTEWLEIVEPLIAEQEAQAAAARAEEAAEREQIQHQIDLQDRSDEIAHLNAAIEQLETARQGVQRTAEQLNSDELSELDQEQLHHILRQYDADIAEMKSRLSEIQGSANNN